MTTQVDCPICMDCIEMNKNCVTTECGHCFHASCLMKSVAHNGFGCPYCRTEMAEAVGEEEESVDDEEEEEEMFDDNALRGFRFFWNNSNGLENDAEDVAEEEAEEEEEWEDVEEEEDNRPTPEYVAQKLLSQGTTFEQLVSIIMYRDHPEYNEEDNEQITRMDELLFGKIRIIVSNYERQQNQAPAPAPVQPTPVQNAPVQPVPAPVDFESQPKNVTVRRNYGFLSHV
jgi:Ring finger domain